MFRRRPPFYRKVALKGVGMQQAHPTSPQAAEASVAGGIVGARLPSIDGPGARVVRCLAERE
jgi:hypothetical protein